VIWALDARLGEQRVVLIGYDVRADSTGLSSATQEAPQLPHGSLARDEFISQVVHELRAPLAPMSIALELLDAAEPSARTEAIRVLQRQIKHLVRLIDDLASLDGTSQGNFVLRRERVDLAAIIEQALELAAPALAAGRQRLSVEAAKGLVVEVDAGRIVQVIANLVLNAAKYSDEGGSIGIAAQRADDQVVIRVRDQGIGIAADILPHVFEMSVRSPRARHLREGQGLGLFIVQALVRQHGGSVEARSQGPGHGSEFIVKLPYTSGTPRGTPLQPIT
jgi:signal transduction histidine kinase